MYSLGSLKYIVFVRLNLFLNGKKFSKRQQNKSENVLPSEITNANPYFSVTV